MFRFLSIAAALVVSLSAVQGAVAQMVRTGPFGGVEVRLPRLGVYVDVLPFGQGTRVRAPLTSVNTGVYQYGYGYRPAPYVYQNDVYQNDVYQSNAFPSVDYSAGASAELEADLREAAARLQQELAQRPDGGDAWLRYLAPHQIIAAIDNGSDPQALRALLMNYEGVANSRLNDIHSTPGYRETHHLLSLWVNGVPKPPAPPSNYAPPDAANTEQQNKSTEQQQGDEELNAMPTEELPAPAAMPQS